MTNRTMTKEQILDLLREHKALRIEQFGIHSLALFGSTARDQAKDSSDIDILVQFDGPATSKRYFGLQFYIEDLLGRRVDLVTDKALRKELRPLRGSRGRGCLAPTRDRASGDSTWRI